MKIRLFTLLTPVLIAVAFISCGKGDTLVTIDDEKITLEQFKNYYYTQNKLILNLDEKEIDRLAADPNPSTPPSVIKSRFMDEIINAKLVSTKALADPDVDKKELETILELTRMQTISAYYLNKKLKNQLTVSDAEVNDFYMANKAKFAGRTADESTGYIKQQLYMQNLQRKTAEFVRRLEGEARVNRDGFDKYLSAESANRKSETSGAVSLPGAAEKPAAPAKK